MQRANAREQIQHQNHKCNDDLSLYVPSYPIRNPRRRMDCESHLIYAEWRHAVYYPCSYHTGDMDDNGDTAYENEIANGNHTDTGN